jgi:hypothetical protein
VNFVRHRRDAGKYEIQREEYCDEEHNSFTQSQNRMPCKTDKRLKCGCYTVLMVGDITLNHGGIQEKVVLTTVKRPSCLSPSSRWKKDL